MKNHEEYLKEMNDYGSQIISSYNIKSSKGKLTLMGLKNFLDNYQEAIKKISDQLIGKANSILEECENNSEIECNKMKDELTTICQDLTRDFINKTNTDFKKR